MMDACTLLFTEVCDRHAPTKRHRVRHQKQPDWLSEDIVTAIRTRNEHKSHFRSNQYKHWRNEVVSVVQTSKASFYKRVIENTKNPRRLWSYLRDLCPKNKSPAPFLIRDGELEITDPVEIC